MNSFSRRRLFHLWWIAALLLAAAGCATEGGVGFYGGDYDGDYDYGPAWSGWGAWYHNPHIYGDDWHYHHGWAHVHPWGP